MSFIVFVLVAHTHARAQREGNRGSAPPLKNHKAIGFLSNTGPDSHKNHKATKPAFNAGPSSHNSEMAFCWQADDGPLLVVIGPTNLHS